MTAALGASISADASLVTFRVRAPAATRLELWVYDEPFGAPLLGQDMRRLDDGTFEVSLASAAARGASGTIYYGYRAWGPNWLYDARWTPGSQLGFVADVDAAGNRFNPNKLLLDPYAREVSHCVQTPEHPDRSAYNSGPADRATDTGPFAPKAIVVPPDTQSIGAKPETPFKDDVIYEVHVRGFTKADPSVPPDLQGTYAGAARRASYLRDLGVTAVEFLPVQQSQNALNDDPAMAAVHNYWGYQTMAYFAPDRRHAADPSPGGPTREFKAMVKAFHDVGLKVFIDVVYNHHEEGGVDPTGEIGTIYSLRGLDNAGYYESERADGHPEEYENETGVGPNLDAATDLVRDLVLDSLRYWSEELGVDGFRFDLGAVLGNSKADGGFAFVRDDPDNILNRAVRMLPARPPEGGSGVDLIAEPYTATGDGQEQGNFPNGWAEWNDRFRDTIRAAQNKLGYVPVTPGQLATRLAGSQDLFGADGRRPSASVNYVTCHDGFTLFDLHTYSARHNDQRFPFGPSDGGRSAEDEMCWDHGGEADRQMQAIRTSLALLLVSSGAPMIAGGTEMHRSQHGNNNPYNLDTLANWFDWSLLLRNVGHWAFTRKLIWFRRAHPALRPATFFTGQPTVDGTIKDVTWLNADGIEVDQAYFADPANHFLAFQLDGIAPSDPATRLLVVYNGWVETIAMRLPCLPADQSWFLAVDTSATATGWDNAHGVGDETLICEATISADARSCLVAVAKRTAPA